VVEEGNHSTLWQKKGRYYHMWQKQLPFSCDRVVKEINKNGKLNYHEAD